MRVRELVEELLKLPQDDEVWVESGDYAASEGELVVCPPGGTWDDQTTVLAGTGS